MIVVLDIMHQKNQSLSRRELHYCLFYIGAPCVAAYLIHLSCWFALNGKIPDRSKLSQLCHECAVNRFCIWFGTCGKCAAKSACHYIFGRELISRHVKRQ